MNDQYDVFCIDKIGKQLAEMLAKPESSSDSVSCACAHYLNEEGYGGVPSDDDHDAETLIPTTTNQS